MGDFREFFESENFYPFFAETLFTVWTIFLFEKFILQRDLAHLLGDPNCDDVK